MREPRTTLPGIVIRTMGASHIAFAPADLDRRFARESLPDHGNLLANLVRWAAAGNIPVSVEGRGLVDCNLYRQPGHLILHVVNLTSAGTWRAPIDELIPLGPFQVKVKLPAGITGRSVQLLVAGGERTAKIQEGWVAFEIASVIDHEVAVIR